MNNIYSVVFLYLCVTIFSSICSLPCVDLFGGYFSFLSVVFPLVSISIFHSFFLSLYQQVRNVQGNIEENPSNTLITPYRSIS